METFIVAGAVSTFYLLVWLVARPRPSPELVRVSTHIPLASFPSGHVINFTSALGFIWFLIYRSRMPALPRRFLLLVIGSLILLVGPARAYSGEHWPSDVLAGYLLGSAWLAIALRIYLRGKGYRYALSPSRSGRHVTEGKRPGWLT